MIRFRSKVDTWLVLLVVAAAIAAVSGSFPLVAQGAPGALPIAVLVVLLTLALPAWLLAATYYELAGQELLIRSGPLRWRIDLTQIRSVTPSKSLISSPALSMDRLRIDYGRGQSVLISPADKAGFLRELEARRSSLSR